jgi:hypothetical protein
MVTDGGWLPFPSRHSAAIAMNGEPVNVKRCFAFGYFLPVNSKKAEAGTRQRSLLSKRRPSERKLKAGPPRGLVGGEPVDHGGVPDTPVLAGCQMHARDATEQEQPIALFPA